MSNLAEELLQDFENSGSEGGDDQSHEFLRDDDHLAAKGLRGNHESKSKENGGMELDGDEEESDNEDEEMANGIGTNGLDIDNEEEAKAKVEKMELGGVEDVRSVAGLMTTLEPVLGVSDIPILQKIKFTSIFWTTALTDHRFTENKPLSITSNRKADDKRGVGRGQSRIPSIDAVKYIIDLDRHRDYAGPQVHSRPLLDSVPRIGDAHHKPSRLRQVCGYHRQRPDGEHPPALFLFGESCWSVSVLCLGWTFSDGGDRGSCDYKRKRSHRG
jgi:hypothetical protein